jgi:hypothetical protein
MSSKTYQIVFTGEIVNGYDSSAVKRGMAELFKIDPVSINQLFCGRPVVVKRNLDPEAALVYLNAFAQAGAVARMEFMPVARAGSSIAERRNAERRDAPKRRQRLRDETFVADRRDVPDRRHSGDSPGQAC